MRSTPTQILLITFLAIVALLFTLFGCSSDPTAPVPQPPPVDELLLTETVGPAGSTLETEKLTIEIPPGTLNEDSEISLYKLAQVSPFGDNAVSGFFRLTGLPANYETPLRVALKYSGALSHESSIAVGSKTPENPDEEPAISYAMFSAADSSGFLVVEVPAPGDGGLKGSAGEMKGKDDVFSGLFFAGLTDYEWLYISRFSLHYPVVLESRIAEVGATFQSALPIKLDDLDIPFPPSTVGYMLTVVKQDRPVMFTRQGDFYSFNIGWNAVRDQDLELIDAGLGILSLDLYLARISSPIADPNIWLDNAILSWGQELFTDDQAFTYPSRFPSRAMAPFNGMQAGTGENIASQQAVDHGIGMSSVVKYLVEEKIGKAGIGELLGTIAEGASQTDALLQTVNEPATDWWPDFFKQYVSGAIYDRTLNNFQENLKGEWSISNATDLHKVFSSSDATVGPYPDLSAKMFMINLEYDSLAETQDMIFSMSSAYGTVNQAMVIFGIQVDGELEHLGTARNQDFALPNLKSYYDTKMRKFLVVLVNSGVTSNDYFGALDIDLTVEVTPENESIWDSTTCEVSIGLTGVMRTELSDGEYEYETIAFQHSSGNIVGAFTGTTFNGSFQTERGPESVVVRLNEDHDKVLFVVWERPSSPAGVLSLSAANVMPNPSELNGFSLTGSAVCASLLYLSYSASSADGAVSLDGYLCDEGSVYLTVSFGGR